MGIQLADSDLRDRLTPARRLAGWAVLALFVGCASTDAPISDPIRDALIDAQAQDAGDPVDQAVDADVLDMAPSDATWTPNPALPQPGGAGTHAIITPRAFLQPVTNLSARRRASFEAGRQFFLLDWEPAPDHADIDGLGPTYNTKACADCHHRNGRGALPFDDSPGVLLRLGDAQGAPDPTYGGQLQTDAIPGVPAEGRLRARHGRAFQHPSGGILAELNYAVQDLMLHDMGEALDDGMPEGDARSSEWRTPPLWGLGLVETVNGTVRLMHDGRARSIEEAILWHGGEAERAVFGFTVLDPESKQALLDFVRAL